MRLSLKKTTGALLVGGLIALQPACSTINPYTGEKQTSKATQGAAIGAVAGAVIGAATGKDAEDRRKRALQGAGVGAIAGSGVGYYMDVQEAKLRQQLEATGVSVIRDGENIILNMPGDITFSSNSSTLQGDILAALESVSLVLKEYKSTMIQIGGHTDSSGGEEYNMLLSKQRAQEVANALMDFSVQPERISVVGFGESQPIASNSTASGKAKNRRVELILLPITE